ncbi:MAG: isoaspartyl peptidase/L-asparaginase [Methylibium sp.]|nr:isoaspartyl peptidase/L-asparaginase [Methylibium sp.]
MVALAIQRTRGMPCDDSEDALGAVACVRDVKNPVQLARAVPAHRREHAARGNVGAQTTKPSEPSAPQRHRHRHRHRQPRRCQRRGRGPAGLRGRRYLHDRR